MKVKINFKKNISKRLEIMFIKIWKKNYYIMIAVNLNK